MVPLNRRLLPACDRSLALVDQELRRVLDALAAGRGRWPLFLHGEPGAGKTCATLSLCDVVETAAYATLEEIVSRTLANDESLVRRFSSKALIVVDEIGARQKIGDAQYSALKNVLDVRELAHNRVGIYISNVTPTRIAELFDDRIASRLLCGTCFELLGTDRRFSR
ncbi:MAG TPA: hypothetical protein VHZ24_06800 [Pirellulales bacterium]|jgi:DNA replication protein DnaC|nr:hypothetical protein [Pirellulales bacterium]